MPIYYYIAAILLVIAVYLIRRKIRIFRSAGSRRNHTKVTYRRKKLPLNLGLREEVSYEQTVLQLEKSFNKNFQTK